MRVPIGERLEDAAGEWADARMMDPENALETKTEQALLEVEHLASGDEDVEFTVEDGAIRYEPSDDLRDMLADQADRIGADPGEVLGMHLELFARTFLPSDTKRPPDAPGGENF